MNILLSDRSWFWQVSLLAFGLITSIILIDTSLRGTRFGGFWALYLVPPIILTVYIYLAFRFFVWLRNFKRNLPIYIQEFKDDLNGKMYPKTPEIEASEAANTAFLRSIYLAVGLVLLVAAKEANPLFVSLSFSVGLLGAFLAWGLDNKRANAQIIGIHIFFCAMTGYVFFILASGETLLAWGAGYICGFATFNSDWSSGLRRWSTIKKLPAKKD